jgi:hypothetical protein
VKQLDSISQAIMLVRSSLVAHGDLIGMLGPVAIYAYATEQLNAELRRDASTRGRWRDQSSWIDVASQRVLPGLVLLKCSHRGFRMSAADQARVHGIPVSAAAPCTSWMSSRSTDVSLGWCARPAPTIPAICLSASMTCPTIRIGIWCRRR